MQFVDAEAFAEGAGGGHGVPGGGDDFAEDMRATFKRRNGDEEAGEVQRRHDGGDGGEEDGGDLRAGEGGEEQADGGRGAAHQQGGEGEGGERAFHRQPEPVAHHQVEDGETQHGGGDVGELFADEVLQAAGGRGVVVGDAADFAFADDADSGHHRRKEGEGEHEDAGCDGVHAFEVLVVGVAGFERGSGRRQGDTARACLFAGVGGKDSGDVGVDVGGVEGFGAVDVVVDFRPSLAQQVAAKVGRDVDGEFGFAAGETVEQLAFVAKRRQFVEVTRAGEWFDDGAAFGAVVVVEDGVGEVFDVEGDAPGDGGHKDDRAEEGEEGADVVAQQFCAFAAGKGPGGGEPVAQRSRFRRAKRGIDWVCAVGRGGCWVFCFPPSGLRPPSPASGGRDGFCVGGWCGGVERRIYRVCAVKRDICGLFWAIAA